MRKYLIALMVLLALALAACGGGGEETTATEEPQAGGETTEQTGGEAATVEDPWGVVELAPGEPVKIGFAAGLSGDVANLGIDMQNAAELAVEDKPEIKGHPVELVVEDSQCSGEGGTAVAQKFAADGKILGVVGHMCSSASIPASDIYEQAHIVMISPSSTAVALTNRGLETVNRVAWNDAVQGSAAAEYLYNELGVKKVAVIHDGSAYGQGLADVFKETFEGLGGEVTDYEGITVGEKDFRATLTKIAANAPEAIYFGGFQAEAALLVSQKNEVGLEDAIFFTDDGAFSDQYIEAAGGAAEGSYATFADLPAGSPELEAFRARYKEKYGVEPSELGPFHAHAYDATMVLLNAIEKVAVEREDGTLLIPRKALAEAVRATKDYQGLSGTITCDEKGDCGSANIIIYQVQNGEWVRVFPPEGESMGGEAAASWTEENGLLTVSAGSCDYGGLLKEIRAVDELTVQFTMCAPDPAFPSKAAFAAFAIQPREHLEATGGSPLENPVGTGPYMLESWNRGESIVFKRFDDYWGDPAQTETLVFRWSTEGAARLLELQSGTVDGIDNPSPDDYATIEADPNLQLIIRPALNVFYIGMNNTYEPFNDERVRQAIAMGIDRERIVKSFYPEGSEVASHFTPCAIPNGCAGEPWYDFDPERARELLAEAGYPDGFKTKIYYRDVFRSYLPEPGLVAQDIQAQLKENLNIDAEIVVMESGAFIQAADAGELDGLHLLGWGADYPHVTNFLDFHFGAGASKQFGEKFPDIVENLQKGAQIADPEEARPYYEAANNAIKQHVPMVPVAHGASAVAYRADVENAHASPLGNEYFAVMKPDGRDTFVWMQNAEPISLYCGDETDGESLRACEQVTESLLAYEVGGTAVQPALATSCDPNEDLTVWTCKLREGVKFHDGSTLDANDVVVSWGLQWDASHPLHKGNSGAFTYFSALWGGFINDTGE